MTFASTVEKIQNVIGDRKMATGTFAQASTTDTGGNIDISGFYAVDHISVIAGGSAATVCGVNETFPLTGSSATVVCGVGTETGTFIIFGR